MYAGAGCEAGDLDRWTKLVLIGVGKGDSGLSSRRAEASESPVGCNPIKGDGLEAAGARRSIRAAREGRDEADGKQTG